MDGLMVIMDKISIGYDNTQDYTIRTCERLSDIAKRMNTTVEVIMTLNPQMMHKNHIYSGQKIKVPMK